MAGELTDRRQLILKYVIQEFIESAQPVSSKGLVERYLPRLSSATVRNELAVLEELGYLTHRHTSDGRVPTDAGYRYFVENLMERAPLALAEKRTIRHQFYQVRSELDQWIQLAGAVLARTSQNASVITLPRAYQARFKHLELIAIHDTTVLMVLVLHDGSVKQQTLTLDSARGQDDLRRNSTKLSELCGDCTVTQIDDLLAQNRAPNLAFDDFEQQVLDIVIKSMHQIEEQINAQIHSDGLIEMLNQPEFTQVQRVRQMLEILQDGKGLGPLIPQVLARDGVQVVIGGEHGKDEMREYSVVLSRYGITGAVVGVLGIIGPTRMAYPRSISTVDYISTVMSDLLSELYGRERT